MWTLFGIIIIIIIIIRPTIERHNDIWIKKTSMRSFWPFKAYTQPEWEADPLAEAGRRRAEFFGPQPKASRKKYGWAEFQPD